MSDENASAVDLIASRLVARLQGIAQGNTWGLTVSQRYNYTPDRVLLEPCLHKACMGKDSFSTVYVVSPADERGALTSSFTTRSRISFDLSLCRKVGGKGIEDPHNPPAVRRWDEHVRMLQDVRGAILSEDLTFGNLVCGVDEIRTDRNVSKTYVAGWAVAIVRWVFLFDEGF